VINLAWLMLHHSDPVATKATGGAKWQMHVECKRCIRALRKLGEMWFESRFSEDFRVLT
jgi:hypothetical protein